MSFFFTVLVITGSFFVPAEVMAQAAFKAKVTFYDFHEDLSNPAFENPFGKIGGPSGDRGGDRGWFLNTLTSDRKPQIDTLVPDTGDYWVYKDFGKWFRPWQSGTSISYMRYGDTILLAADSIGTPYVFDGDTLFWNWEYTYDSIKIPTELVTSDTCYKNVTIDDSVIWIAGVNNGDTSYTLLATDNRCLGQWCACEFLPIDGKGFEAQGFPRLNTNRNNEPVVHNFGFTMELHNTFTYKTGQWLQGGADDGLWIFINNKLVINGPSSFWIWDSCKLDTMQLTAGQEYPIDIFYAERHSVRSACWINCNFQFNQRTDYATVPYNSIYTDWSAVPVRPESRQSVRNASSDKLVTIGKGISLKVPNGTRSIVYSIVNMQGRSMATSTLKIGSTDAASIKLPVGIYIVKAVCFDSNKRRIGTSSASSFIGKK